MRCGREDPRDATDVMDPSEQGADTRPNVFLMSFFDLPPQTPPPPEPRPAHSQRPWFGPPHGVIPGYSPQLAVIFRTESAILRAGQFLVYPAGLEFTLSLLLAPQVEEWFDCPWEPQTRRRGRSAYPPEDLLRFGILYADGSKWTNLGLGFPGLEMSRWGR